MLLLLLLLLLLGGEAKRSGAAPEAAACCLLVLLLLFFHQLGVYPFTSSTAPTRTRRGAGRLYGDAYRRLDGVGLEEEEEAEGCRRKAVAAEGRRLDM